MNKPRRLLVDSNTLIDYLAVREPHYPDARKLMILGALNEVELWLSSSQLNDIFYILSRGRAGVLGRSLQNRLKSCRSIFRICAVRENDFYDAIDSGFDDLEDACVAQCARSLNADFIITRDRRGFEKSEIPAISASDYFGYLGSEYGLTYEELFFSNTIDDDVKLDKPVPKDQTPVENSYGEKGLPRYNGI